MGGKKTAIPHYSTLISSLSSTAWLLNLRGGDVPRNPLFHAYLWVGVDKATLSIDAQKLDAGVKEYLKSLKVSIRKVSEVWGYFRKREFGCGKVIISPKTPYAVSLMLTYANNIIAPSYVEATKAIKNSTEIDGFHRGIVSPCQNALPHYSPTKGLSSAIDVHTPYLNNSGGQYKDGMCDITRIVHLGHPSDEQCEAFTRVLKGHIAIDSAIFPRGTTGKQLDVSARHAL